MISSTSIAVAFFSLHILGIVTTVFAFVPVLRSNSNHKARQQGSKLNYVQEVQMHGVTLILEKDLSAVRNVADIPLHEDKDDFIDPMEEAFDSMQHPVELMLLNRACIPYVAM